MKTFITAFLICATVGVSFAQNRYFTRTGKVSFFSSTPVEDIEAHNNSVSCVVDITSGAVQFSAQMKSFKFEKALMEEHFNENYVESHDYPKAVFKGKITNLNEVDFSKNGTYEAIVQGTMTMHGESKEMEARGTFTVKSDAVSTKSEFTIVPEDYNIEIPDVVRDKIAKEVKVSVVMNLEPLKR